VVILAGQLANWDLYLVCDELLFLSLFNNGAPKESFTFFVLFLAENKEKIR
jgi:hypothetical protein